eukprot:gene11728-biopygen7243
MEYIPAASAAEHTAAASRAAGCVRFLGPSLSRGLGTFGYV